MKRWILIVVLLIPGCLGGHRAADVGGDQANNLAKAQAELNVAKQEAKRVEGDMSALKAEADALQAELTAALVTIEELQVKLSAKAGRSIGLIAFGDITSGGGVFPYSLCAAFIFLCWWLRSRSSYWKSELGHISRNIEQESSSEDVKNLKKKIAQCKARRTKIGALIKDVVS